MPEDSPRGFLKGLSERKRVRWMFTAWELEHPEGCRGDDPFVAYVNSDEPSPTAVKVLRNGVVKAKGLTHEQMSQVEEAEIFYKPHDIEGHGAQDERDEQVESWKFVFTSEDGSFAGFAPPPRPQPGSPAIHTPWVRPGADLADSMLEAESGDARTFLRNASILPTFYRELRDMGWTPAGRRDNLYNFDLTGFFVLSIERPGRVRMLIAPCESQLVGVAFYDYTTHAPPIGTFYLPWETLKPVLKAWMSGLKRDVPDDPAKLPSYNQWLDTWDRLYRDLKARAVKEI